MKKYSYLLFVFGVVLILSGCQREQDRLYEETMKEITSSLAEKDETISTAADINETDETRELTIRMCRWRGEPSAVEILAEEFMELHPDVLINFEFGLDYIESATLTWNEQKQWMDRYYSRLRTELLSGEADYILYDLYGSDQLDFYQISRNDVFLDLWPYWENDPEIHPEDYFMDIIEACMVDGKMTALPFSFMFYGAYINSAVYDELELDVEGGAPISTDDILGWYEQAVELDPELQFLFSAPGKDQLFEAAVFSYIDVEEGRAAFSSPEFIEFLERTGAVVNDDPELDERVIGVANGAIANQILQYQTYNENIDNIYGEDHPGNLVGNLITKARNSFAAIGASAMFQLVNCQQPFEYMSGPFPLQSTNGRIGVVFSDDFAVPASCKEPELAWEFMKYCISEREDVTLAACGYPNENYTKDIPLHKKNFERIAAGIPEYAASAGYMGYSGFTPVDAELLLETAEQIFSLGFADVKHYSAIDMSEFLDEYYEKDLISAEECADKMQNRAEIWLSE